MSSRTGARGGQGCTWTWPVSTVVGRFHVEGEGFLPVDHMGKGSKGLSSKADAHMVAALRQNPYVITAGPGWPVG